MSASGKICARPARTRRSTPNRSKPRRKSRPTRACCRPAEYPPARPRTAMSEQPMLWLIPAFPLLGAIVAGFFGPKWLKNQSHWPVVVAVAGSCVVTILYAVVPLLGHGHEAARIRAPSFTRFEVGHLTVDY